MATAQVVSATTAFHDEKIEEQLIKKPEEDIKKIDGQEPTVTAPEPQEDQLSKEPADTKVAPEPEQELVAPEPEPEAEPEVLAVEIETKVVLTEEEGTVSPVVDQPAKVAPEPEPVAKETKEPEAKPVETVTETETGPIEVPKADTEPEEKVDNKEEVVAAEE